MDSHRTELAPGVVVGESFNRTDDGPVRCEACPRSCTLRHGQTDSMDDVAQLCYWMVENVGPDTPLDLTAFHPDFKMLNTRHTPAATLRRAWKQARYAGRRYIYTGNLHNKNRPSRFCVFCGALLIEREWYELVHWGLEDRRCRRCGHPLPRRFKCSRGSWGAHRMPAIVRRWADRSDGAIEGEPELGDWAS